MGARFSGELPVSLSGPIANPTTRQKSFLTLMNSKANRLWGRDPPVYCNLLSSCDRTSEQKSRCRVVGFAIGPDRLTGSSPVPTFVGLDRYRPHNWTSPQEPVKSRLQPWTDHAKHWRHPTLRQRPWLAFPFKRLAFETSYESRGSYGRLRARELCSLLHEKSIGC
jgi:hypothetical protein